MLTIFHHKHQNLTSDIDQLFSVYFRNYRIVGSFEEPEMKCKGK